jgi:membrane protein implicated in regulation of membrane protease activity
MKFIRILAVISVIFLAGLYVGAIIAALSSSPAAGDWFKACIFLSVVLPVLLYGMALVGRGLSHRNDPSQQEEDDKDSSDM